MVELKESGDCDESNTDSETAVLKSLSLRDVVKTSESEEGVVGMNRSV